MIYFEIIKQLTKLLFFFIVFLKELQERGLKITRATEQLATSGPVFGGEPATQKAYNVLAQCAEYLHDYEQRRTTLENVIRFYHSAREVNQQETQNHIYLKIFVIKKKSPAKNASFYSY